MSMSNMMRQQAALLIQLADLCDKGDPYKATLERLDNRFPRKDSLGPVEMAEYWDVCENTARERMHASDFPAETLGAPGKNGRLVVTKIALALYEIRRAG